MREQESNEFRHLVLSFVCICVIPSPDTSFTIRLPSRNPSQGDTEGMWSQDDTGHQNQSETHCGTAEQDIEHDEKIRVGNGNGDT